MNYWKLGCRWGSKKDGLPLFIDLLLEQNIVISWVDSDFKKGNVVLLTDGFAPLAIAVTKSERKPIENLRDIEHLFNGKQINFDDRLFYYEADIYQILTPDFQYKYQVGISHISDEITISNINRHLIQLIGVQKMENLIKVLERKKQIILQGPPGTGKTRLAKQIANVLANKNFSPLTENDIKRKLTVGSKISNASGVFDYYSVEQISDTNVTLSSEKATKNWSPTFKNIIEKYYELNRGEQSVNKNKLHPYELAVAKYFVNENDFVITDEEINSLMKIGEIINTPVGKRSYEVKKNNYENRVITLKRENGTVDTTSYNKIIDAIRTKLWEKTLTQNDQRRAASLAKFIFDNMANNFDKLVTNNYVQLVQFHPSYTYEDFVRGITVKSGEKGLEYITENKILGKIAKAAYQNYLNSEKEPSEITKEKWIEEQFEVFKNSLVVKMDTNGKLQLNDSADIIAIEDDGFRYSGSNWGTDSKISYKNILHFYKNNIRTWSNIKNYDNIGTRATYNKIVVDLFFEFMNGKAVPSINNEKEKLKNYVLIIDEINRANLSSVLGELIYALEYRGEPVESMYEMKEEDNSIILPPNLYIIGTMNTADRSVGQIDYAIRRRFSFVNVLPEIIDESTLEKGLKFNTDKFNDVEVLFIEENGFLSEEFKPKDVQLGHSYFIYTDGEFDLKLEYEIKPILREYVADGILKDNDDDKILDIINAL